MGIPPLDGRGLLPPGIHTCHIEEIPPAFCFNDYRWTLWDDVMGGLDLICSELGRDGLGGLPVFLGGSFFSDKALPADIEATVAFPHNVENHVLGKWVRIHIERHHEIKRRYRLDFYPSLPGRNDFRLFFGYVGEKTAEAKNLHPKDLRGILEVNPW